MIPKIEAIVGPQLSFLELDKLIAKDLKFIEEYPLPVSRYDSEIEKIVEEEIERAYRAVPAGISISYLKGVEEFRYYLIKKKLYSITNNK
jgi:hypothetical protein